jgi:hypothetical protein
MRNTPKDIRGTMMGIYQFFGVIGSMAFTKIGTNFFNTFGPSSPFWFVLVLDIFLVFLLALLSISNKFND